MVVIKFAGAALVLCLLAPRRAGGTSSAAAPSVANRATVSRLLSSAAKAQASKGYPAVAERARGTRVKLT